MFSKILKKFKANDKIDNEELILAIRKMNITEMRHYVTNRSEVSEDGLIEILNRLIVDHEGRYYLDENDEKSKLKNCFDLIILILRNSKTTSNVIDLAVEFIDVFEHIIKKYDRENRDIYASKFLNSIANALTAVKRRKDMEREVTLIHNG
jgi:hypothetical protein